LRLFADRNESGEPFAPAAVARLRVCLEAQLGIQTCLLVSSAAADDGADDLAAGLARSFAAEGFQTAHVRLVLGAAEFHVATRTAKKTYTGIDVSVGSRSAKSLEALIVSTRSRYDVVIVEGAPLPDCEAILQAASIVDGVILAVRAGRQVVRADREIMPLLTGVGARVLGAVMTRRLETPQEGAVPGTQAPADAGGTRPELRKPLNTAASS